MLVSKRRMLALLAVLGFLLSTAAVAEIREAVILSTNDFHSAIDPIPAYWLDGDPPPHLGGAAELMTLIEEIRAREAERGVPVFLFDSGDMFTGMLSKLTKGEALMEMMATMGYDALGIGNHEFDYGWENFRKQMFRVAFPSLGANIFYKGTNIPFSQPHAVIERGGVRLGVIGVIGQDARSVVLPSFVDKLDFEDPAPAIERSIAELESDVDLIVVLAHQGHTGPMQTDAEHHPEIQRDFQADIELCGRVPDIDVFLGGHAHRGIEPLYVHPQTGAIISQTYGYGTRLGFLRVRFDTETGEVVSHEGELLKVWSDELEPHPVMARKMAAYEDEVAPVIGEVVGRATRRIVRSYNTESPLGAFSSDVLRERTGANVAFMNAGGLRADLPEGEITLGNVQEAFPFYNTVVVQELTGRQIREILEQGFTLLRGMIQVSGLVARYDLTRPVGERLVDLEIDGEPVDDERVYTSATNRFLAEGGDLYETFTRGRWIEEIDRDVAMAIVDHLKKLSGPAELPEMGRLVPVLPGDSGDQRLNAFLDAVFERHVADSPEFQSRLGRRTERLGEWDDRSDAFADAQIEKDKADLARLRAEFDYDSLSEQGRLSYDLFVFNIERTIRNHAFRRHSYVADQFRGQFTSLLTVLQNNHPVASVADAEDYLSRVEGLEGVLVGMVKRLRDRAEFGVIPPAFAFPAMLTDASRINSGAPIDGSPEDNALYADFKSKLAELELPEAQRASLMSRAEAAWQGPFQRGFAALIGELQRLERIQTGDRGVWSLPNGEAYYRNRIRNHTTLDLTAEEIHQIGLDDVARIHTEMEAIKDAVGFEGTLQEFFAFVRTDPNNFYEASDAGRAAFLAEAEQQTADIFAVADRWFNRLPKAKLEVRRVEPWRENSTSIAFYNSPSQDGSRPGVYYANLADMTNVQKYVFTAITYHEGVPGHHFQIALAQELEGLPMFRKFGGYGAYTEGWALYAERLAKEMGFYREPMRDFGRLQDEIWRSVRLVTDTGIHAKRWTRQQAIDYFTENTPISEGDIITEVERYFVNPGQALGYKMGMIQILALRDRAQRALGERFDIRDFHDIVIGSGALPLTVLERQVDRYIAVK